MEELQTIIDAVNDLATSIHITSDLESMISENFESIDVDDCKCRNAYRRMFYLHPALSDRFEIAANLVESIFVKLSEFRQHLEERAAK